MDPVLATTGTLVVEVAAEGSAIAGTMINDGVDALTDALRPQREKAVTIIVRVQPDVGGASLARLLLAASRANFEGALVDASGTQIEFRLARRLDSSFSVALAPQDEQLRIEGKDSVSWLPGDIASEEQARERLAKDCKTQACVLDVHVFDEVAQSKLLRAMQSLQRVKRNLSGASLWFSVASKPPDAAAKAAMAQAAAARAAAGKTVTPTGRLPPELIQRVVREHFSRFRVCYERGLARDPNLRGRMSTRFMIGLDGKAMNVTDFGSDIPDREVRDCVVRAFEELVFPKPEGGVVTVVYPIMLAPG